MLIAAVADRLSVLPLVSLTPDAPLSRETRFGIGGPAALLVDALTIESFADALRIVRQSDVPHFVIGGGTNLVVSDSGFDGIALRLLPSSIEREGRSLRVEAGAVLQDVVDRSIECGLKGMETMTGIPGGTGGAIYGNAGAYGHSVQELVETVHFTDGDALRTFTNEECQFRYRESIFKNQKGRIILSAVFRFSEGDPAELAKTAAGIRTIRDAKYPPTMKCAGSIFKNLLLAQLPANVQRQIPANLVRDGKVPSAWFLEQVDAKGMRAGDIQVATYHANLIYNDGHGTSADLVAVIQDLKKRVRDRFGFDLEEEVQYVGFA